MAVPPVFVDDVVVFYTKDDANVGNLHFYKWNGSGLALLKVSKVDKTLNQEFHKFSLVKTKSGVIYKEHGGFVFKFF